MKLYIGNATRQNYTFSYRVIEERGLRTQQIPVGTQVRLSGDFNKKQVDHIIQQHARYGMVAEDAVERAKGFAGLVYALDRPISVGNLTYILEQNTAVLVQRGIKNRQDAAVATSFEIERAMGERGDITARLGQLDMSVVEEEPSGGYRPTHKPIGEGITITREEKPGRARDNRRVNKGRRRA